MAQRTPNDPCNNYGAGFLIDPNPPTARMIDRFRFRRLAGFATTGRAAGAAGPQPGHARLGARPGGQHDPDHREPDGGEGVRPDLASANPLPGTPRRRRPKLNTPEHCKQATYCDVIPLEVVLPPTLKPSDEFFVTVTLEWETDQIQGVPAGGHDYDSPRTVNDLDLYVWNDPVRDEEPTQASATAKLPERPAAVPAVQGQVLDRRLQLQRAQHRLQAEGRVQAGEHRPAVRVAGAGVQPGDTPPVPFEPPVELPEPETPALPIDTSGCRRHADHASRRPRRPRRRRRR